MESAACDGSYSASVGREIDYLRSNRVSLRAVASLRGGAHLYERSAEDDAGNALLADNHRSARQNSAKPTAGLISQPKSPHRMTGREKETTMTVTTMKCFVSDPTAMGFKLGHGK